MVQKQEGEEAVTYDGCRILWVLGPRMGWPLTSPIPCPAVFLLVIGPACGLAGRVHASRSESGGGVSY